MLLTTTLIQLNLVDFWEHAWYLIVIHGSFSIIWFPLSMWLLRKYHDPELSSPFWIKLRDESTLTTESADKSLNAALSFLQEIEDFERE